MLRLTEHGSSFPSFACFPRSTSAENVAYVCNVFLISVVMVVPHQSGHRHQQH